MQFNRIDEVYLRQNRLKLLLGLLVLAALPLWNASAQTPEKFVPTGNMTTPRQGHTATLLKDGRVLITGGSNPDNRNCLKSAELYDPATGTFTETGGMLYARTGHKAILLPDGRVFIVGGCYPTQISAEVYDPLTGTSTGLGEIPGVWWTGFSPTLLKDGRVLLSGGLLINPADGRRGGALALLYDPTTNKLSSTSGITRGAGLSTANLLPDGTVLIAGGSNSVPWSPFAVPPPDAPTALYNAAVDQFEELTTGPGRSIYHSATSLTNGKVLFAGGASDDYGDVAESQATLYDPVSRIFKTTGNLLRARAFHTGTLLKDGRVLITGGFNGQGLDSDIGIFSSAELYDPSTGRFADAGNMSRGRDAHTATLLTDGRVLIAGGRAVYGDQLPPIPDDTTAELFVPASVEGPVPKLSLDKTQYCAGDSWRLRIDGAVSSSSVQLMGISLGTPWEIPDWRSTDLEGTLTESGTFASNAIGDHTLWALSAGKTSNSIVLKIVSCPK
jgi:hypothetical protein